MNIKQCPVCHAIEAASAEECSRCGNRGEWIEVGVAMSDPKSIAQLQAEGLLRPLDSRSARGEAPMTDPKRAEPGLNEHLLNLTQAAERLSMMRCSDSARVCYAAAEIERLAAQLGEHQQALGNVIAAIDLKREKYVDGVLYIADVAEQYRTAIEAGRALLRRPELQGPESKPDQERSGD